MPRYAITQCSVSRVLDAHIENIKVMKHSNIIFGDLSLNEADNLRREGYTVEPITDVHANIVAPKSSSEVKLYSPETLCEMAGFNDLKRSVSPNLSGVGLNIAVMDTGIRETHDTISGKVIYSKNYSNSPDGDNYDHGTGVASIIATVSPGANILDMKIIGDDGVSSTEYVVEAIDDSIDMWYSDPSRAPAIINLSAGSKDPGNPNDPLRVACRAALENRIWVSAAAGNYGPDPETIVSPACEHYVMAVGSVNPSTYDISNFSSRGPTVEGYIKPDSVFFGEDIEVASSKSDDAITGKSGTSFSTPFNSGISALIIEAMARTGKTANIQSDANANAIDVEVPISAQQMIDYHLNAMCIKPQSMPVGKGDTYGYGMPSGELIAQSLSGVKPQQQPSIVSSIMMVGMINIMARMML